ncbi:ArsR/SmtB family transcription factor, partial [Nocardiopsis gilva]
ALRHYYRSAIEPHWQAIQSTVRADLATRTRALMHGGGEALLDSLAPFARWQTPVLEMNYPVDQDLHLDGRGLRLVPSFFCWRHPVSFADPGLPPVIVYPVGPEPGWDTPDDQDSAARALAALVGPTRAWILELLAERSATTTDLARAAGVSPATVSKHAAVLRDAALISSRSEGRHVLHTATMLGLTLLRQS